MPGTFTSATTPVIPGFYPDPTVCRVGDDYYLATSSFEYFPGAPLFHSRDLVSWRQIGNILTTREQFAEGESRPSQGIYGSTLRFHDGRFFFVTTNVSDHQGGQIIVTAERPEGPWSAPVRVPRAIGIDPDLCWDGDRCLLTWKALDLDTGGAGIQQAPVDPRTGELLADPYPVWQGSGMAHAEAPHLSRIGAWWYLMLAEGGTERGHSVTIARASAPEGPYEPCPHNPLFTRRSTSAPVQSVGHADLVEGPDGTWAAVHLGTRPRGSTPGFHVLGRETFLAGVDWRDGWPVFVSDRYAVPVADTAFDDAFEGPLDHRWVVPSGDLNGLRAPTGAGVRVPAGRHLCARVRDLRWEAEAAIDGVGGFELRIDPRHAYGVRIAHGVATAFMRVAGVTAELGSTSCGPGSTAVTIAAVDPGGPPLIRGDAGPDEVVLSVRTASGAIRELGRLDGRYLSTEVAAGFTGRMLAVGSETAPTHATRVVYRPVRSA